MPSPASGTVDPAEVARFERIARTWWDPDGAMKTLHRFNPVRIGFVRDRAAGRWDRDVRGGRPLAPAKITSSMP